MRRGDARAISPTRTYDGVSSIEWNPRHDLHPTKASACFPPLSRLHCERETCVCAIPRARRRPRRRRGGRTRRTASGARRATRTRCPIRAARARDASARRGRAPVTRRCRRDGRTLRMRRTRRAVRSLDRSPTNGTERNAGLPRYVRTYLRGESRTPALLYIIAPLSSAAPPWGALSPRPKPDAAVSRVGGGAPPVATSPSRWRCGGEEAVTSSGLGTRSVYGTSSLQASPSRCGAAERRSRTVCWCDVPATAATLGLRMARECFRAVFVLCIG